VVYVHCPALTGRDLPMARQVPLDADLLRRAVEELRREGRRPEWAGAGARLASAYSVACTARLVDDVYDSLVATP
jgi:hypothetical protein